MNDPHVKTLIYSIEHNPYVIYDDAAPIEIDRPSFTVQVRSEQARFDFKEHYDTAEDAREVLDPFIQAWEVAAGLERSPDEFTLVFERAEFIDRAPTPGALSPVATTIRARVKLDAVLTKKPKHYPSPPVNFRVSPDVDVMYYRYRLYRQGRDQLGNMANFCLGVLEWSVKGRQRSAASKHYRIDLEVLSKMGKLVAEKGGREARKAKGKDQPFNEQEKKWIDETVRAIIRRTAEMAHNPNQSFSKITLADLPLLDSQS